MPILDNPKHEAFCQARANGETLQESYRIAGFRPNRSHAARLATKGIIRDRLKELRQTSATRAEVTTDLMADQLDFDRAFAHKCKSPSAAVAATIAKAKLYGLLTDRSSVTVTHNYAMMTEEELRFEIAAIHAEARAIKAGVQTH